MITHEEALNYHSQIYRGKLEIMPVKPCSTQKELSLAYTPGVAAACRAIAADPDQGWDLTGRGNLVAVISNGTAVLGLGNIGPLAGKPVMEGKGVLFKILADVDVYDLNIQQSDPEKIVEFIKMLEPTFGGINIEDIKAPECFMIEQRCIQDMDIPIFHDDQHGTAIISGAGLLNALEIIGKKIKDIKVVVSGAGASAIACATFYVSLGVQSKNVFMFDSKGLLHKGRLDLTPEKFSFAHDKNYGNLTQVMAGADCFLGLSVADAITPEMVASMGKQPIIFACANPDPEIPYTVAKKTRPDCIMATGRSDFPNQINNVLGFPFIFRGALDVRARKINEAMKVAATQALAALAKEPVPNEIKAAYGVNDMEFGMEYIIPKPFDNRVLEWESTAVAQAAMDTGVAQLPIADLGVYKATLRKRLAESKRRIAAHIRSYGL
ncbi:Malate dehydrogenase [Desulfovibrionales bacterium]